MEISLLLTLPKSTSNGLGFLLSSGAGGYHGTDGSQSKGLKGPINIQVVTDDNVPKVPQGSLDRQKAIQLGQLRKYIKEIMKPTKDEQSIELRLPQGATFEKIYSMCRTQVTVLDGGWDLYDGFVQETGFAVAQLEQTLVNAEEGDVEWIGTLVYYCKWFETQITLLKSLLTYLDQVYIPNSGKSIASVHDEAYHLFSERIFGNFKILARIRAGVSSWLQWERTHPTAHEHRQTIPDLVKYLTVHNQFNAFEQHYVDVTQAFYTKESEEEYSHDDALTFFKHAQARLAEEQTRVEDVLPVASWSLIQKVTESSLLEGRVEWLSKSLLPSLMDLKDTKTLGELYTLFTRVGGLGPLEKTFQDYIRKNTEVIVKDTARDEEMVQRLLELKALAEDVLSSSFLTPMPTGNTAGTSTLPARQKDKKFVYALDNAFTYGFRARRSKHAEMIAKHLHNLLRKGQGAMSDAEYDQVLDAALGLYRYSDDKDVFRTFYHRLLAKRLLVGRSASDDVEAAMLKKLKEKYDPEFGMGEDMFKDLALSKDLMKDYLARKPVNSAAQKLNVVVLQRSAWPFSVPQKLADLPLTMQDELSRYTDYYKAKHVGRVLDWDHALGTATLKARFKAGSKDLSVSLYQAVVLLLFNEEEEIGFKEIAARVRMNDPELRRTLQSLACGKKKVLRKIPPGRDVEDNDAFRFNADFEDPHARVHINSIQAKVTHEETERTNESIEGDRKSFLDAAIVRIMKSKKELTYEQLKAATIEAVKSHFVPSVDMIKKRVDSLVESEYLRRDDEDRNRFFYVA